MTTHENPTCPHCGRQLSLLPVLDEAGYSIAEVWKCAEHGEIGNDDYAIARRLKQIADPA